MATDRNAVLFRPHNQGYLHRRSRHRIQPTLDPRRYRPRDHRSCRTQLEEPPRALCLSLERHTHRRLTSSFVQKQPSS